MLGSQALMELVHAVSILAWLLPLYLFGRVLKGSGKSQTTNLALKLVLWDYYFNNLFTALPVVYYIDTCAITP